MYSRCPTVPKQYGYPPIGVYIALGSSCPPCPVTLARRARLTAAPCSSIPTSRCVRATFWGSPLPAERTRVDVTGCRPWRTGGASSPPDYVRSRREVSCSGLDRAARGRASPSPHRRCRAWCSGGAAGKPPPPHRCRSPRRRGDRPAQRAWPGLGRDRLVVARRRCRGVDMS